MLIKNLEAAIERVHELLEKQHAHFRIEDHLTGSFFLRVSVIIVTSWIFSLVGCKCDE